MSDKFEKCVFTDPFKGIQKQFLFKSWDELVMLYDTVLHSTRITKSFFGE
jgi:hypothetical protein